MERKKRKIAKKISLKELRELIITETRKTLCEKLQKADTYVGCFYCEDVMPRQKYDVWVHHNKDGYRPHMHIKGEGFETCVELEKEQYFLHYPWHKPFPNSKVRDAFAIFIESPNKASADFGIDANYKIAVIGWNSNLDRPRVKVTKDKEGNVIIPNYRVLETK